MFWFADRVHRVAVVGVVVLMGFYSSTAASQPAPETGVPPYSAAQLDQLVAPIALYPDPLIAQILMAATYPAEVVEADRWLQSPANTALKGDALTAALQQQPWDPSVKSLVSFPQLLHTMDANLQWTEQLGDAFLAQPADVMDAVQRLRQRAQGAGALASTPQLTVSAEDQEIMIEPANPEIMDVPVYNPWCIYGAWPYPDFPPFYFGTWAGACMPADYTIAFDAGIYPPFGFWAWGAFDWRHHLIRIDRERFQRFRTGHEPPGGIWRHDPTHRRDVPYRDPITAGRFTGPANAPRRESRGFAPLPATPGQPVPQRPLPHAFESFGSGAQVRGEAARGLSSRMAPALPPAMPSFHAAPAMPSFHGAPAMPSFHGGGRR
jgi:Protein of unknown function (DUF3300)